MAMIQVKSTVLSHPQSTSHSHNSLLRHQKHLSNLRLETRSRIPNQRRRLQLVPQSLLLRLLLRLQRQPLPRRQLQQQQQGHSQLS